MIRPRRFGGLTVLFAVTCAIILMFPAGCGRSGDRSSADTEVELEFWTLALSPFGEYVRARIRAFESGNPGVRVRWVDVPFEAADRKLIAAAAAGRAPDVVNLSDRTFARFVGLGAMADLRPLLPGEASTVYLGGALAIGDIDGRLLALPWYLTTQVGLANRRLLGQGGLDERTAGTDWRSLLEQAPAFRRATGVYLFSQPLGEESQLPIMLLAEGLSPLREDGRGRLAGDLERPEIIAFVDAWVSAYRSGALPPEAATRDHSHLTEMYQSGRLALIDTGANFLARIRDVAPGVFAQTAVRRPCAGSLGRSHIATMVVCVTSTSRHPRLAAELAWFLTSAESQAELCRLAPVLPSARAALDEKISAGGPDSDDTVAQARALAAESLRDAVAFTPALVTWPDLRRAFEEGIKRALLDGEPTPECLKGINAQWNRILDAGPPQDLGAVPRPTPVSRATPGVTQAEPRP